MEKKKKKKLSIKGLIVIILMLYLTIMAVYFLSKMPPNEIIISGNNLTTDSEIINITKLNNNTPFWRFNTYGFKKKIKSLPLISNVKIKNYIFKVKIEVEEEKVMCYYERENKYILSNNEMVTLDNIKGVPTLINFVPSDILTKFITKLDKIDSSIINLISEIKYDVAVLGDVTIDDERFLLKMNDGNSVYVNIVNLEKLDKYKKVIATLDNDGKGILSLDSNLNTTSFITYEKYAEEKKKEVEENELPEDVGGTSN